jgi:release factor glutamine methyltransferase
MRNFFRRLFLVFYRPYALSRISKDDVCKFKTYSLHVPKTVFHPCLFFSTKFLAKEMERWPLANRTLLDVGCGSGALSILAASKGALVTSIDINPKAIAATKKNFELNQLTADIKESNLFDAVGPTNFDYIVINPPYFKKAANNFTEKAWNAGCDNEYFKQLFRSLPNYMKAATKVFMVLSEDVNSKEIQHLANAHDLDFSIHKSANIWFEKNFIFSIKNKNPG